MVIFGLEAIIGTVVLFDFDTAISGGVELIALFAGFGLGGFDFVATASERIKIVAVFTNGAFDGASFHAIAGGLV